MEETELLTSLSKAHITHAQYNFVCNKLETLIQRAQA